MNGKGCQCAARCASECGCEDVDWTPREVVRLREELERVLVGHMHTLLSLTTLRSKIQAEIDWLESRRNSPKITTLGMVQQSLREMLESPPTYSRAWH